MAELDRFMAAIRTVESGGNYRAIGPRTKYGRATGAYQFLDSTWANYGGYRSAKDAPQSLQDARAAELMTAYYRQFGSWDLVAVAWHGGPGAAQKARASGRIGGYDAAAGISTDSYTRRVMSNMGVTVGRSTRTPTATLATNGRPVEATPDLIANIGKQLQQAWGLRSLGQWRDRNAPRGPGQAKNSDHYWGGALDLAGTPEQMKTFAAWARNQPMFKYVIYEGDPHHEGHHVHVSFNKSIIVPGDFTGAIGAMSQYQATRPKFALTMQSVANIFGGQSPLNEPPVSLVGSWSQPQNQMTYTGTGDPSFSTLPYTFAEWGTAETESMTPSAAPASARIAQPTTPRPTSPTKVIGAESGRTVSF